MGQRPETLILILTLTLIMTLTLVLEENKEGYCE